MASCSIVWAEYPSLSKTNGTSFFLTPLSYDNKTVNLSMPTWTHIYSMLMICNRGGGGGGEGGIYTGLHINFRLNYHTITPLLLWQYRAWCINTRFRHSFPSWAIPIAWSTVTESPKSDSFYPTQLLLTRLEDFSSFVDHFNKSCDDFYPC